MDQGGLDALAAMGARYNDLLSDRTALQLQLQAYAACDDAEVRAAVRDHLADLWPVVDDRPRRGHHEAFLA